MKKVHLIGNAHLDPVWLWQWQEGFAEIKATFKSALDRMREFDDFKFTSACSAYYMWIEKSDPAMFEEIRQRVREGRWELVGGWLIQPDCNIPCGESFARHALVSQRYFAEKFGKMAETGYNVDSFGHNGSLPMILNHSRMKHYVFMRPGTHEKELPANLFSWESADGSRVTAYRIPFHYNIDDSQRKFGDLERIAAMAEHSDMMAFYGIGNHGGGPTVALLQKMHADLGGNFIYSTTGDYFAAQKKEGLPVVRDDLQYHAKGCYSACSEIKKNNRMAENKLLTAERLCVLSGHLLGTPYPAAALERGWHNVLFNQFHDIMGGCSIREAYDDARNSHGESMTIADRESNFAMQQIGWNIDTVSRAEIIETRSGAPNSCQNGVKVLDNIPYSLRTFPGFDKNLEARDFAEPASKEFLDNFGVGGAQESVDFSSAHSDKSAKKSCLQAGSYHSRSAMGDIGDHVTVEEAERMGLPIVVFNPHAYPVTAPVRVVSRSFGKANFACVCDDAGRPVPTQQTRSSRTNGKDREDNLFLAAVPALGYAVYRGHTQPHEDAVLQNSFTVGENFVTNGRIRLTFDGQSGEPCSLYDEEDKCELLAAPTRLRLCNDEKSDTWAHGLVAYTEEVPLTVTGNARLIEQGPVRVVFRTEQCFGNSRMIRDYALVAGEKTVTVTAKVDYHEKFGVLKLCFPVNGAGKCYAKIPFGHIERPTDGSEQVCGDWITLGDLTVANDSKHSFDAKGGELSLTALRSALFADHFGVRDAHCEHMEQGEHRFAYSLAPFADFAAAERQAALLQTPLTAYAETFHRGSLPQRFSGITVSAPNVVVTAVKAHASGQGTVLRCLEVEGKDTQVEMTLLGTHFSFAVGHNAVKTLWLHDGRVEETDFVE